MYFLNTLVCHLDRIKFCTNLFIFIELLLILDALKRLKEESEQTEQQVSRQNRKAV